MQLDGGGDGGSSRLRFRHYLGGHARTWDDFLARIVRIARRVAAAAPRERRRRKRRPRIWRVDEPYRNARWDGQHRSCCVMFVLVDVCTRRLAVLGASNDVSGSFMRQPRCEAWLRRFAARLGRSGFGWRLEMHPLRGYAGDRTFRRAVAALVAAGTLRRTVIPVPARAKESGCGTSKSSPASALGAQEKTRDDKHHGDGSSDL
jgi:hypothetical protein